MEKGRYFKDFEWLYSIAETQEDKRLLRIIENDHKTVFEKGKFPEGNELFSIRLGGYILWFKRRSAYSSIEIYTEIFKYNNHTYLDEFKGKYAEVVVDIGACEGYYSLKIKRENPECKIIAIEPNPYVADIFKRNMSSNRCKNIKFFNMAVYSKSGERFLEYTEPIPAISSFNLEKPWLSKDMIKKCKVKVITLPQIFKSLNLSHIDILKIDTEGSELEILESSKEIFPFIKRIVVEYHSEILKEKLLDLLEKYYEILLIKDEEKTPFGEIYLKLKKG